MRYVLVFFMLVFCLGVVMALDSGPKSFEVSSTIVKSVIKMGESVGVPISVLNNRVQQGFNVEYYSKDDFFYVDKSSLLIGSNEGGTFNVIFNSRDFGAGVYVGNIVVSNVRESVLIPVVLEVETRFANFDVSSEVSLKSSELSPGGGLELDLKLYNFGSESGDVVLEYKIVDIEGRVILKDEQELNVKNQAQINREFLIPSDAEFGSYVFMVSAVDKNTGSVGTHSLLFNLVEPVLFGPIEKDVQNFYLGVAFSIIAFLIVTFLFFDYYWNKRLINNATEWKKRLVDVKKVKFGNIGKEIRSLEYQRSLLEKAHDKGYVKNASYLEGKKKLNGLILQLNAVLHD